MCLKNLSPLTMFEGKFFVRFHERPLKLQQPQKENRDKNKEKFSRAVCEICAMQFLGPVSVN